MSDYLTALKDVLVVLSPIIIAYISYRSNKKTKEDVRLEIEKSLKKKMQRLIKLFKRLILNLKVKSKLLLGTTYSLKLTNTLSQQVLSDTVIFVHLLFWLITSIDILIAIIYHQYNSKKSKRYQVKQCYLQKKKSCTLTKSHT